MSKKAVRRLVLAVFIILLAIAVIAGKKAYQKSEYEFKLASHPMEYQEYVDKYAREYGLDKYLLYAVIKTESSFDSEAVSNVGARGLMQIMEETFDWIQFRLGEEGETAYDDMFDPETNIRYGAYLVSYLLETFGQDVETAAAAYHSGAGQVSEWLDDGELSSDGKKLDEIPSSTASHYVDKIMKAYETYKELYLYNE